MFAQQKAFKISTYSNIVDRYAEFSNTHVFKQKMAKRPNKDKGQNAAIACFTEIRT